MRQAWVMRLKPGNEAEYKKKHDDIWPEMTANMERQGIRNYSIYRYGNLLFAYLERDDAAPTPAAGKPPADDIVWKWWAMVAPLMETNPDTSPVIEPVEEMFYFAG
jgi:L-rhamnose mutarotase